MSTQVVSRVRVSACLAFWALWVCVLSTSMAYAQTGWTRSYLGAHCIGIRCTEWEDLDRNGDTVRLAASGGHLYQLQSSGNVWRYNGISCINGSCPGWQQLDNNPATSAIFADGNELYQLQVNGLVWRFTGTPCSSPSVCGSW